MFNGPPVQVYELAPPPLSTKPKPSQTSVVLVEALTIGIGYTVRVIAGVFELTQPAVLEPTTEYVVVIDGETVSTVADVTPFHV